MKKILISALLVSLITVSCKKEETPTPATNDAVSVFSDSFSGQTDTVPPPPPPSDVLNAQPMQGQPATTTMAQPVATAKGMNPAHGQPGHRCDIAVGAPLNMPAGNASKPAPMAKTTTISSNTGQPGVVSSNGATITTTNGNTPAPTTISPIVTPAGMNPPHGQEGHDCAVAVGAPLPKK